MATRVGADASSGRPGRGVAGRRERESQLRAHGAGAPTRNNRRTSPRLDPVRAMTITGRSKLYVTRRRARCLVDGCAVALGFGPGIGLRLMAAPADDVLSPRGGTGVKTSKDVFVGEGGRLSQMNHLGRIRWRCK